MRLMVSREGEKMRKKDKDENKEQNKTTKRERQDGKSRNFTK